MVPVAAIITTRNEELNIAGCLQSLAGWIPEIYVIDSESTDRTCDIVRQSGATLVTLPYDHGKIIPWIFQWGLDNLPIQQEWVLILEADQTIPAALREEIIQLFQRGAITKDGFYIKKMQVFRGRVLRFGGYGSKYLLKLFRKTKGQLDAREQDTRVYVDGDIGYLGQPLHESNAKEDSILFYLEKHLRYADAFAHEELDRRQNGWNWKVRPTPFGSPDQRVLWLKTMYYKAPLFWRPIVNFVYRYILRLGILDGKQGFVFHFLQAFWFRLIVDVRLEELLREGRSRE